MADYTYQGAEVSAPVSEKIASMANWLGAAASIALVVGVGVWGYRVMARDVSGVPVVQAMAGPMRVAPENPGGTMADHQGLAVNTVAGQGAAEGPADRLVLAPVPAGLSAEDVATGLLVPQSEQTPAVIDASLTQETGGLTAPSKPDAAPQPLAATKAAELDPIQALADQLAAEAVPLTDLAPVIAEVAPVDAEPAAPASTIEQELAALAKALPPGLERSLRPKLRPATLKVASRDPSEVALLSAPVDPVGQAVEVPPSALELNADDLPAGTRLVQVGIFNDPEGARAEWDKLDLRFADFLTGKSRVVQKANRGGREFYRLRVHGFADLSDARRFCATFMAQNVDCIPVVTK